MTRPLNIYLADLVHDFRPNHFCTPLGVGFVAEYVRSIYGPEVDIRLFKSPGALIEALKESPPDMVGLSNYSWNYEINRFLQAKSLTVVFRKAHGTLLGIAVV